MKQKSIKNIRKEFEENGIFYTPPELAKKLLTEQGMIFMEIGYDQGQAVKEIFESEGFVDIVIKKDLCKNDRVVIGRII